QRRWRLNSCRRADTVAQSGDAGSLGAVLAAEESPFLLEAVAHDADAAILAFRRQRMDRTFEAVEGMGGTVHAHLERLVVIVPAGFTSGHGGPRTGCLGRDNPPRMRAVPIEIHQ